MQRELVIIGGGPGGYAAAIHASKLGAKVTLIEKSEIGGTCLNRGCIPTKALYHNSKLINKLKHSEEFGINIEKHNIDFEKINLRKNCIVNQLRDGLSKILLSHNVEILNGTASFFSKDTIKVLSDEDITISAKNIIIATGSIPHLPDIKGVFQEGVMTSNEILDLKEIPKSIIIVGGGVIGLEFAGIFNAFGSKVTIIESMPNIINDFDNEISKRYLVYLRKSGIKVEFSTNVTEIKKAGFNFLVITKNQKEEKIFEAQKILLCVGRKPNVANLSLELAGVYHDNKVIVDKYYKTNVDNIYAIGDVNGSKMLAHLASEQGKVVAQNIFGLNKEIDNNAVISCVYSFPEIASVGITEEEAKKNKIEYKVGKFNFAANGMALCMGESEGFVKVLEDQKGKILGVHILGPQASSMIHEGALAMLDSMTSEDIMRTIHAHPTLNEVFYEAVCDLENKSIYKM